MLALDMLRGAAGAQPTLDLNFVSGTLDSRVTFTRASSATRVNASGVLEVITSGNPRFTYDPVTHAALGLLIEEQRTNLLTYSEQFDNAAWTKGGATVTANAGVAPDGNTTADSLVEGGAGGTHNVIQNPTVAANTQFTYSIYVKRAVGTRHLCLQMVAAGGSDFFSIYYDLGAGTVGAQSLAGTASISGSGITNIGNGWFRVYVTAIASTTAALTTGAARVNMSSATTAGSDSYAGDSTSALYLWGAQCELGAFATSYIPTTSASVTRAADSATMTGSNFSSWFNASAGTFVPESCQSGSPSTTGIAAVDNGSAFGAGNGFLMRYNSTFADAGGNNSALHAYTNKAAGQVNKFATSYVGGVVTGVNNGGTPATISGSDFTGVGSARLIIGGGPNGALNAPISRLRYYPTALTNAQLQALTT